MSKFLELTSNNRGYNNDSGMVYKYHNGNSQYEGKPGFRNAPVADTYVNPKNVSHILADMNNKAPGTSTEKHVLKVDHDKIHLAGGGPVNATQKVMDKSNKEATKKY